MKRTNQISRYKGLARVELLWAALALIGLAAATLPGEPVPTTLRDFFGPGTQPFHLSENIVNSDECIFCHALYDEEMAPYERWAASLMGQATRDPMFWAAMAIAEQDASFAGDLCLRCHTPKGWLEGRSTPTDGSALLPEDFQGVSCNFCHRMVDPEYKPGISPAVDEEILTTMPFPPESLHSGHYVVDPLDRRRGPFELTNMFEHQWLKSPFHQDSNMCATCHDVSNPVYTAQPDGTYALNDLDVRHPTHDKYDQFPMERTFSEWSQSAFADGPIEMGGRFGGNITAVSSCQDCHMPDTSGYGALPALGAEWREDLPQHNFNGGNTWVLLAIRDMFPDGITGMSEATVDDSIERAKDMLRLASDMELSVLSEQLRVRIINQTGHKLPTGYPEGRRMWLNIKFFNPNGTLLAERGHYDFDTATLTGDDTKVYHAEQGVDQAVSDLTGIPVGPSFHFAVNNMYYIDNRIPPMGFNNANFQAVQASPVDYTYADGQYWDTTVYTVPAGASRAEVRMYSQTTSREFIEFLRDQNKSNKSGQIAYDQWLSQGKSEPAQMDFIDFDLSTCAADFNADGNANTLDFLAFLNAYSDNLPAADFNIDGRINTLDFLSFLNAYSTGCP